MTKKYKKILGSVFAVLLSVMMIGVATLSGYAATKFGNMVDNSTFAWRILVEYSFGTTGAAANHGTTLTYKVYLYGEENSGDYHDFAANHIKINGWYAGQTEGASDTNLHYTRPTALRQYGGSGNNRTLIIAERSTVVPAIYNGTTRNFYVRTTVTGEGACNGNSLVTISVPVTRMWKITYNANGGEGGPTVGYKYNNCEYTVPTSTPTRTGYDFVNWKISETGNTVAAGGKITAGSNADYTLVAQWKKKTYAVNYYGNPTAGVSNVPAAQTKTYGTDLKLSSTKPTRSGYTFLRWNTKTDGSGTNYNPGATYTGNAALSLFAQWSLNTYVISYNANGGIGEPASQTKTHGTALTLRTQTPTRTGYTFQSWNTNAAGTGTNYAPGASYTGNANATLYAKWKPNTYKFVFHPNSPDATGTMPDQTFTYDASQNAYANAFINPGFRFVGWDTDPNATPSSTLLVRGDSAPVLNLTDVNDTVFDVYAVWRPIGESDVEISAGKTLHGDAVTDEFTFRIEPVEGWRHENESTRESGTTISAAEMPLPEGTPPGQRYKDITINGFAGNPEVLRSGSFGLISFEDPGWYMYKVTEVIPPTPAVNVIYDKNSYYVVAYVEYKEAEGYKLTVSNTTVWHNSGNSGHFRPDVRDISEITDNNDQAAVGNTENVYGKVDIGTQGVTVKFWNRDYADPDDMPRTNNLRFSKNVTGSLGDISKQFEFTAHLSGLAANTTYTLFNEDAELGDGFDDESFHTDSSGNAELSFKVRDDEGFLIRDIPSGAKFEITEKQSDHFPSYEITTETSDVKSDSRSTHGALSTGLVTMSSERATYTVLFTNSRDLAENTGVLHYGVYGIPLLVLLIGLFVLKSRKKNTIREE